MSAAPPPGPEPTTGQPPGPQPPAASGPSPAASGPQPPAVSGPRPPAARPEDPDPALPQRWTRATVYPDVWLDPADDPRELQVATNDERSVLLTYLQRYRLTLELKCADLDADQLARRSVPPSTMSLLGLVRHLAEVERHWFRRVMAGRQVPHLYRAGDPDGEWTGAVADPDVVAQAWENWRAEVGFAQEFVAAAPDLAVTGTDGVPLRDVLVHLVEEYARHCGHADLLRERIDGRTGQ